MLPILLLLILHKANQCVVKYVVDIQNFLFKKYAAGKAAVHYKDITEKSFLSMEELCLG